MQQLTSRQEQVLSFIRWHIRRYDEAPSYRAIAAELGVSVKTANQHVQALERKDILARTGRRIELNRKYRPKKGIPLVGSVAAGTPILAVENIEEYINLEKQLAGRTDSDVFLLRVKGESMKDVGILDNDLALVRSQPEVDDGDIAAVIIGDEATIKYVHFGQNTLRLEPANNRFKPIILGPDDDVRIAGKVLMSIRQL